MSVEVGHYSLILALCLALTQGYLGIFQRSYATLVRTLAQVQFFLCIISFFGLLIAFALSDFSALDVILNSHTAKPLLYKLTALWSHHEGSLLLWILILSGLGAVFNHMAINQKIPQDTVIQTLGFLGFLSTGFMLFVLMTSNPFYRTFDAPIEGLGLNPLLQDPGLAFHPPILYLGYVGISVPFALCLSLLHTPLKKNAPFSAWLRPWILISWGALTLGITMGSWWAYYVLGWGGWWFWDPVENAALMPWLSLTALMHVLRTHEKTHTMERWIYLLVIITFLLCLIGTFLVRSGVLASVHNFASAPERGLGILLLFITYGGLGFILYARAPKSPAPPLNPLSREGCLALNNILLGIALLIVFFGTLYPLLIQSLGLGALTVGAPYFNLTIVPLIVPLVLAMAVGQRAPWGKASLSVIAWKLSWMGLVIFACMAGLIYAQQGGPMLALLGVSAGLWALLSSAQDIILGLKRKNNSLNWFAMQTAHLGFALMILGMSLQVTLGKERDIVLGPNITAAAGPYTLKLVHVTDVLAGNYYAQEGLIEVIHDGHTIQLKPQKRTYIAPQITLSQTSLSSNGWRILYAALGEKLEEPGQWVVRFYDHPFTPFIWYGGLFMALAALLSLIHIWRKIHP